MSKYELFDNTAAECYEFHVDGEISKIDYMKTKNGEITLTHTEIPDDLRGQGIGTELVHSVLADIEKQGLKVIPLCGFVIAYIKKHPEWKRIVLEGTMA